ncbi:MAG: NTP transferase domain-containing protein [Gammaproteobacteria bacterium]
MKAVILAAGVGRRLGDDFARKPKCLLAFNGRSLLERHVRLLTDLGTEEIVIGIGYQAQQIHQALKEAHAEDRVRTVYNPYFERGSIVTLWAMRRELASCDALLLMDADVLYDRRLLERLINSPHQNVFLLDRHFEPGEEPMKLCVRGGQLVEFRKQLARDLRYDFIGESVGFFRFSGPVAARLAERSACYFDAGEHDAHYEEAIRDLLLADPKQFGYEDISGLPWIEIDFREDIERAKDQITNRLSAE